MSVEVERATVPCQVCGAAVTELRRGRCWGCYLRWTESRPVGRGAACIVCFERRRDQLRLVELQGRSLPFCHGCAGRMGRMDLVPESVDEMRRLLRRDRRDGERRGEGVERRVFPRERRVGERRGLTQDAYRDTDPQMRGLGMDDVVIEIRDEDIEVSEQTNVRLAPPPPPPEDDVPSDD
jgi:hypothetical protein